MKKSMKKLLATALLLTLLASGCSGEGLKEKKLAFSFDDAAYLLIDSGEPEKAVKITDKDRLQEYADEFRSHKYVKQGETSTGEYCYRLVWYDEKDQAVETVFIIQENGYRIGHDGSNYKVGADLCINKDLFTVADPSGGKG